MAPNVALKQTKKNPIYPPNKADDKTDRKIGPGIAKDCMLMINNNKFIAVIFIYMLKKLNFSS